MFGKLLRLFRKHDGDISKAEFLSFPEVLSREKALQERAADANKELLIGNKLRARLVSPIQSLQDAVEIFEKSAIALQLEPTRTTNIFFKIVSAPSNPEGLTMAISNIMRISHQFAGPNHGLSLDLLLASWTLCKTLATRVVTLGARPKPPEPPSIQSQTKKLPKGRFLSKSKSQYQRKVDVCLESNDDQNQSHEHDCKMAFWKGLLISDVLWNVGCGAEVLNDQDFETLLHSTWGLFEDFDAIVCLLGPVGWGRLRPQLDALREVKLQEHLLGKDREHARSELQKASLLLQHVASLCQADPRLARIAALHGVSFLADRMRSTANASVNFADEAVASAAAQVNRSAAALNEELREHVEDLLEGRKVECRFKSGHFKILAKPVTPKTADNSSEQLQQRITPNAVANTKVKQEQPKWNSNTKVEQGQARHSLRRTSTDVRASSAPRLSPVQPHKCPRKGDRPRTPSGQQSPAHSQKRVRPSSGTSSNCTRDVWKVVLIRHRKLSSPPV
jgi:hypothetical protein